MPPILRPALRFCRPIRQFSMLRRCGREGPRPRRWTRSAMLRQGQTLISFFWPAQNPDLLELAREGRHRHRHGHGAAHLARPEDGRALLHGQHRRLPRRDRGRQPFRPLLHRPGHRRRQGAAGQGAGGGRRRGRTGGDRHGDQPRRHHLCLRRAPRGGRADRVHGRAVRLPRLRGGAGRRRHRRLCRALEPRVPREAARQVPRARAGDRHRHHHRPDPRPAGAEAVDGRHGRRR